MAGTGNALPRNQAAAKPEGESSGARRPSPRFGVLDKRVVLERARRRQARVLVLLSGVCIAVPLLVAAVGNAFVASYQVRSDGLSSQVSSALQTTQDLQLQRAELGAPSRILAMAENDLHMTAPPTVTYLAAVDPGPSVLESHGPGSTVLVSASKTGARALGSKTTSRTRRPPKAPATK